MRDRIVSVINDMESRLIIAQHKLGHHKCQKVSQQTTIDILTKYISWLRKIIREHK